MNNAYSEKDWSELTHAYGTAEDVPQLLENLNSPDPQIREEACSELFGNIWHQGSVYPATVKAFPKLLALMQSPACIDRNSIAVLVASIADGDGFYHVHGGLPGVRDFCLETLTHRGSTLGAELEREADYLRVLRDMVLEALPVLLPLLDSPDWCVREAAVALLPRYSAHLPDAGARLENRLAVETHEDVRLRIEEALTAIRRPA